MAVKISGPFTGLPNSPFKSPHSSRPHAGVERPYRAGTARAFVDRHHDGHLFASDAEYAGEAATVDGVLRAALKRPSDVR